jgi:hypothetical protein
MKEGLDEGLNDLVEMDLYRLRYGIAQEHMSDRRFEGDSPHASVLTITVG